MSFRTLLERYVSCYFLGLRELESDARCFYGNMAQSSGNSGDNGPATSAQLARPWNLAWMPLSSNLLIVDVLNGNVRQVDSGGIITTIGISTSVRAIAVDSVGTVYTGHYASPGFVSVLSGGGFTNYAGGGAGTTGVDPHLVSLNYVYAVSVDLNNNVWIGEATGGLGVAGWLGISDPTPALSIVPPGALATFTLSNTGTLTPAIQWSSSTDGGSTWNPIAGATMLSYSTPPANLPDDHTLLRVALSYDSLLIHTSTSTTLRVQLISTFASVPATAIAVDSANNLFVSDPSAYCVRRVDYQTGVVSVAVGQCGTQGMSGDGGLATSATVGGVFGLAFDSSDNLFIADATYHTVRKVTKATGIITRIAGIPGSSGTAGNSGLATLAQLNQPHGLVVDNVNNVLYIVDTANCAVRLLYLSNDYIDTAIGQLAMCGYNGDGAPGYNTYVNLPLGIAIDPTNGDRIFTEGNGVRRVSQSTGLVSTIDDTINIPSDVTLDSSGIIYVSSTYDNKVYAILPGMSPVTFAGTGVNTAGPDGVSPTASGLQQPIGIKFDSLKNLYIAESGAGRVRVAGVLSAVTAINLSPPIVTTTPGSPATFMIGASAANPPARIRWQQSTDHGVTWTPIPGAYSTSYTRSSPTIADDQSLIRAQVSSLVNTQTTSYTLLRVWQVLVNLEDPENPWGAAIDASNNIFVVDAKACVKRIDHTTRLPTVIAGQCNMIGVSSGDGGLAVSATMTGGPSAIALDAAGNVYFVDNHSVRKVTTSTGKISTVAGSASSPGFSGDGMLATAAQLNQPLGLAIEQSSGDIYIGDHLNCRVRKVSASNGVISTVAGSSSCALSGDGGAAAAATLSGPKGLAFDPLNGDLLIADNGNNRVRRVNKGTQIITSQLSITTPQSIAFTPDGTMYISCDGAQLSVSAVLPGSSLSTVVAGNGIAGAYTDGSLPTSTSIASPNGIATDSFGNLYIPSPSAGWNAMLFAGAFSNPVITTNLPAVATIASGQMLSLTATVSTNQVPPWVQWSQSIDGGTTWSPIVGANSPTYTVTATAAMDQYQYRATFSMSTRGIVATQSTITKLRVTTMQTYLSGFTPNDIAIDASNNVLVVDGNHYCIRMVSYATQQVSTFAGQCGAFRLPIRTLLPFVLARALSLSLSRLRSSIMRLTSKTIVHCLRRLSGNRW